jgi:anti-anti-sigma factor
MYLSLRIRFSGHTMIVRIAGEIDMKSGPWLRDFLLRFLRISGTCLLADLSGVTFIDCAGLRTLITTAGTAQLHASALRFTALSPAVRRVAELTGRWEEIPLAPPGEGRASPRRTEALAAVNGPTSGTGWAGVLTACEAGTFW